MSSIAIRIDKDLYYIATNILKYESMLREAGIPEKETQAHAKATAAIIDNNLATKHDLVSLETSLKKDIEITKRDTIIWLGSIVALLLTIGLSVLGYIIKH